MLSREFLTDAWIERQIRQLTPPTDEHGSLQRTLTAGILTSIGASEWEAMWGARLRSFMTTCELEYVRGDPAVEIRSRCRNMVESFLPEMPGLDFSARLFRGERMLPSAAKRAAEKHGGRWWQTDQYSCGAEWSEMNQPLRLDIMKLWLVAAISGDRELALRVTAPYRTPANPSESLRLYILRHALADDRIAESELVKLLRPGYAKGEPKLLIEFPIAVHRGDEEMLRKAVKTTSASFVRTWDVERMRAWFEKRVHSRSTGTWEQVIERTKLDLLSSNWVISWWALAWLNIARWRGMTSIFRQPSLFSEWVPRALCDA